MRLSYKEFDNTSIVLHMVDVSIYDLREMDHSPGFNTLDVKVRGNEILDARIGKKGSIVVDNDSSVDWKTLLVLGMGDITCGCPRCDKAPRKGTLWGIYAHQCGECWKRLDKEMEPFVIAEETYVRLEKEYQEKVTQMTKLLDDYVPNEIESKYCDFLVKHMRPNYGSFDDGVVEPIASNMWVRINEDKSPYNYLSHAGICKGTKDGKPIYTIVVVTCRIENDRTAKRAGLDIGPTMFVSVGMANVRMDTEEEIRTEFIEYMMRWGTKQPTTTDVNVGIIYWGKDTDIKSLSADALNYAHMVVDAKTWFKENSKNWITKNHDTKVINVVSDSSRITPIMEDGTFLELADGTIFKFGSKKEIHK